MSRETVAYLYGLPVVEVEKWPEGVVAVFARHAAARGRALNFATFATDTTRQEPTA